MAQKVESKSFLKVLYTIFLAVLITLFLGLGVSAFYPAPKVPESPYTAEFKSSPTETPAQNEADLKYQADQKEYQKQMNIYNRNVSMIMLGFAVLVLVASLLLAGKVEIIPDGLMLGSVFTLIYSIGRGFATEDSKYIFVIVTIGLAITLAIGYLKFLRGTISVKK